MFSHGQFLLLSLSAIAFWGATGGHAQGLVNGDFEIGTGASSAPPSWIIVQGKLGVDSQKRKQGQYSGRLDGERGPAVAMQDVPVTAGSSYVLSGAWRNGDKTAAFDVARVVVIWLNAPGGIQVSQAGQIDSGEIVGEWATFQLGPLTAPPNAGAARLRLMSTFGIAAFDELRWDVREATAAASGSASPNGTSGSAVEWKSDLTSAYQMATAAKKRVLLFFAGTDPTSKHFEKAVFADPAVMGTMHQLYVAVKLPYELNVALAQKLQVSAPGTIVLYGPDGAALCVVKEQVSVADFENHLRR